MGSTIRQCRHRRGRKFNPKPDSRPSSFCCARNALDLHTPLTTIRIQSEAVGEGLRAGFIRNVARLEQMIGGILAFARVQKLGRDKEVFDLSMLVEDLVAEARAQGA